MALQEQVVDVEWTGGLETKENRRRVIPGKLLDLENCAFPTADVPSRRPGMDVLADTSTPAMALASTERELLRWTANGIDSLAGNGTWVRRGDALDAKGFGYDVRQMVAPAATTDRPAVAHANGVTAYVWAERTDRFPGVVTWEHRLTLADDATGIRYVDAVTLTLGSGSAFGPQPGPVRAVALGTRILIFVTGAAVLYGLSIDTATPTVVPTAVALETGLNDRNLTKYFVEMDAVAVSSSEVVLFWTADAETSYLRKYNATLAPTTSAVSISMPLSGYLGGVAEGIPPYLPPLVTVRSNEVTSGKNLWLRVATATTFEYSLNGGTTWSSPVAMNLLSFQLPFAVELLDAGSPTGVAVGWIPGQAYVPGDIWTCSVGPTVVPGVTVPAELFHFVGDGAGLVLAYKNLSGHTEVRALDVATLATTARYVVAYSSAPQHATWYRRQNGEMNVYLEPSAGSAILRGRLTSGGAKLVLPMTRWGWSVSLAGDAFTLGGRNYVAVVYLRAYGTTTAGIGFQPTSFVVDADEPGVRPIARILEGDSGPVLGTGLLRPYVTAGGVALTVPDKTRLALVTGARGAVIDATALGYSRVVLRSLAPAAVPRLAQGPVLHVGGASPSYYDGASWTEEGFAVYPEGLRYDYITPGASGLSGGTYSAVAVYEWTDATGRRHQSTPSPPVTWSHPSDAAAQGVSHFIDVPMLRLTKKAGVRLVLYRTTANGTVFYRTTPASQSIVQPDPVTWATNAGPLVSPDYYRVFTNESDATIRANEVLYTTGGELAHRPPPAYSAIALHQQYLFVVRMDGATRFAYSLPLTDGEGATWADELAGALATDTGPLVGLATLDERLILFTQAGEYVVGGQGPDSAGLQSGFTEPAYVTGGLGCTSAASILRIPGGIMRQTSSGFILLGRTMEEMPMGSGVERYSGLTVVRAMDVQSRHEARWYTAEGPTLVLCYEGNQWAVWTLQAALDATLFSRTPHYVASNGSIRKETSTAYGEAGAVVPMVVGTSWLKWAGIQGAQRVWKFLLLASAATGLQVQVRVFVDYNETSPVETVTATYGADAVFQLRHMLARQQCQAVRFVFTFTPAATVGDVSFNGLSLTLGVQRGSARLPAARTI